MQSTRFISIRIILRFFLDAKISNASLLKDGAITHSKKTLVISYASSVPTSELATSILQNIFTIKLQLKNNEQNKKQEKELTKHPDPTPDPTPDQSQEKHEKQKTSKSCKTKQK